MALIDFTNPDACSWYQHKLKALLDIGVDSFKTDFGERHSYRLCIFRRQRPRADAQLLYATV